jgi:hypothetical protein
LQSIEKFLKFIIYFTNTHPIREKSITGKSKHCWATKLPISTKQATTAYTNITVHNKVMKNAVETSGPDLGNTTILCSCNCIVESEMLRSYIHKNRKNRQNGLARLIMAKRLIIQFK